MSVSAVTIERERAADAVRRDADAGRELAHAREAVAGRGGQQISGELLSPRPVADLFGNVTFGSQERVKGGIGAAAALQRQRGVLPATAPAFGIDDRPGVDLAGIVDGGAVVTKLAGDADAVDRDLGAVEPGRDPRQHTQAARRR